MKFDLGLFFKKQIYRIIHIDSHDFRKTVFLAGSARSGTTWLQEIVNYANDYRILFEPFRPEKVELVRQWEKLQYIRAEERSQKYLAPMQDILGGRIKNVWVDTYNKRLFSNKRIIKAIYANLLLYWMKQQFPEVPIILILRHPCAVANSKLNIVEKHFRFSTNPLMAFISQDQLMDDFLQPYESELRQSHSVFETFIYMWCIEYLIPLTLFNEGEVIITFYENLCVKPQEEIEHIFSYINMPFSHSILNKLTTPSPVSRTSSAIISGENLIQSWRKNITDDQIRRALEILNSFGMDVIYYDRDLPLLSGSELLNTFNIHK